MKCPYMKTVIDYTHTSTVYNSDGLVKEVISQNIYIDNMRVCIKDDCAAWRNGKCCYRGRWDNKGRKKVVQCRVKETFH